MPKLYDMTTCLFSGVHLTTTSKFTTSLPNTIIVALFCLFFMLYNTFMLYNMFTLWSMTIGRTDESCISTDVGDKKLVLNSSGNTFIDVSYVCSASYQLLLQERICLLRKMCSSTEFEHANWQHQSCCLTM
jgi:hypothetical protein